MTLPDTTFNQFIRILCSSDDYDLMNRFLTRWKKEHQLCHIQLVQLCEETQDGLRQQGFPGIEVGFNILLYSVCQEQDSITRGINQIFPARQLEECNSNLAQFVIKKTGG